MVSSRQFFLVALVVAVLDVVSASASSASTTSSSSSSSATFSSIVKATPSSSSSTRRRPSLRTLRALEENGYQYLDTLVDYNMQFGKCVRVKVPKDDDDEEGNSYFYNGHYYAQGQQFASVFLCDRYSSSESSSSSSSGGDSSCGVCDTSKEYVVDLNTYLQTILAYAESMCNSCDATCYNNNNNGNNRRKLEDGQDENGNGDGDENQIMTVDCNTCVNTCRHMNFANNNEDANNGNNEGDDANYGNYANDETMYLECQEAFQDGDGYQIYVGPQCNGDGDITIGFYYDEDCTVKSSSQEMDYGFEYSTFHSIQEICLDCNPYGNGQDDVCYELYQDSTHCDSSGRNLNNGGEDEDMPICKTYSKAHKEHFYGKHKKQWKIVETLVAVLLIGGLVWAFLTLSYTYYLRHRSAGNNVNKTPLTDDDHHTEPEVTVTNSTTNQKSSDLPPMS